MKRLLLITLLLSTFIFSTFAKEYSYLEPPSISIMDFDVNMETSQYVINDDVVRYDQDYYGQLINQTLLTILIQKNSANDVYIAQDNIAGFHSNDKRFNEARYFPTLLKIYDKKYVETALGNNNYTVNDLYSRNAAAFDYADLDFVVLGNVYRSSDKIILNVRVLSTTRGEELFSYIGTINSDMSNLNSVCNAIAGNIITDLLKNYCSQFVIKVQEKDEDGKDVRVDADKQAFYFCQSREEYDNENEKVSYNDTFKKDVYTDYYYWILPGDYVFTVYSKVNQTVHEIPVTIDPREIKLVEITEDHFEVEKGSLTVTGIFPTDGYNFSIKEKVKDVKYLWEINQNNDDATKEYNFTFIDGEIEDNDDFDSWDIEKENDDEPKISYNSFTNEIKIRDLNISSYDVIVTPVAKSIQRKGVTGIVYISSREIETSDEVLADLNTEKDVIIDIKDFGIKEFNPGDAFQQTRLTFLFDKAFDDKTVHLYVTNQDVEGYVPIRNIEKLIIEDEYSEEEWEALSGQSFMVTMIREGIVYFRYISFEEIKASNDKIIILDLSKASGSVELSADSSDKSGGGIGGFMSNLFKGDK
ncbi:MULTISPECIES: hypothetical protein [unclassified Oceanispirochaeta]|uniref:hypothetical protein n=1 Tax=unclassified Oceanispirochaeta TaxID=2635722 RepID=UPI000E09C634|nr:MULTISPECIES: hypothetical protein [unclassified Oceanispirochaeta]MBF9014987.1 hypothetical protein [Oceanispirochaeta sp. M2]NPD71332.1 hypothetical protein [Oceanispirochaeta sp. M1]RDG33298.1 hypothetical protein DV872_04385 [Oceanispirochaeta sp. M1]